MTTLNISIPENMRGWIDEQIKNGRYSSASDYLRDLVRADQRNKEELDNMLLKGIHSGPATLLDMKSLKVKAKSQLKAMQNKKS